MHTAAEEEVVKAIQIYISMNGCLQKISFVILTVRTIEHLIHPILKILFLYRGSVRRVGFQTRIHSQAVPRIENWIHWRGSGCIPEYRQSWQTFSIGVQVEKNNGTFQYKAPKTSDRCQKVEPFQRKCFYDEDHAYEAPSHETTPSHEMWP